MSSQRITEGESPSHISEQEKLNIETYLNYDSDVSTVIPERTLRHFTQGPLKTFVLEPGVDKKLFCLWKGLFHSFSSATVSASHLAAACNAVTAFLEALSGSGNEKLRQFAQSEDLWVSVFEVFLDRFEDARPRPMKQVLNTLANILVKHPDHNVFKSMHSWLTNAVISNIILLEPRSRLKAAVVALDCLIRKDAFTMVDVIAHLQEWLWANHQAWTRLLGNHCSSIGIPFSSLKDQHIRATFASDELQLYASQILCLSLLLNAQNQNVATASGHLIARLCRTSKLSPGVEGVNSENLDNATPFWIAPLKHMSLLDLDNPESITDHIFQTLFRERPQTFQIFLKSLPLSALQNELYMETSKAEFNLLLSVLHTGKELGLLHQDQIYENKATSAGRPLVLESRIFRRLLLHSNANTRVSVLALLVSSQGTSTPLTSDTLTVMMQALPFIHSETDPNVRSRLLSSIRKLMVRLRGGTAENNKIPIQPDNTTALSTTNGKTGNSKQFLQWYIGFLETELHPCASYQTHILALKALIIIIQSGADPRIDPANLSRIGHDQKTWSFEVDIFRSSLFRALADLLVDPFEEVRTTALNIIYLFPRGSLLSHSTKGLGSDSFTQLVEALSRVEDMARRTGRADYADALARFYSILFDLADDGRCLDNSSKWYQHKYDIVDSVLSKLEQIRSSSDTSVQVALRNTPVHGYLSALRYIMATPDFHILVSSHEETKPAWRSLHERTVAMCEAIWSAVIVVLCVDSPEKEHENASNELFGPKDILSCSWRALRESSLLLNAILLNRTYAPSDNREGLRYQDFEKIGNLTFTQLAELRHRGAFTSVSQTFASCCQRCSRSDDAAVSALPGVWYKEILNTIHDRSSKLTRRSAGIPALATGVALSAQPKLFHLMMDDLQAIAKTSPDFDPEGSDVKLPQVHAMNCLKDIFSNTLLARVTDRYIMSALNISAECLGSKVWAIRNCGLMLYRALVNRMCRTVTGSSNVFGKTSVSDVKFKVFFRNYPGLIPLLSRLLEPEPLDTNEEDNAGKSKTWELSIITERVFPALELIGSKLPSPRSKEDQTLQDLVQRQFESPIWGIRDHAARAYASLVDRTDILASVLSLSVIETRNVTQNLIHGRALCIRYALQRIWEAPIKYHYDNFESALVAIEKIFANLSRHVRSPYVLSTLIEIFNDALKAGTSCGKEECILSHHECISHMYELASIYYHITDKGRDSTTIRSSSLLLETLTFNLLTTALIRNSPVEEVAHLIATVAAVDADVGPLVLKRLHCAFNDHSGSQSNRIKLYISIIESDHSMDLKVVAIFNLAEELEAFYDSDAPFSSELDLLRLKPLANITEDRSKGQIWNREMANASIVLQGCLLPLRLQGPEDLNSSPAIIEDLNQLAKKLLFAIHDEIEFTTRNSAVISMKCLISGLKMAGVQFATNSACLETLFVLYDMLNDDDEELREYATRSASEVLSSGPPVFLLPSAASTEMASFLAKNYGDLYTLFEWGLSRFLGTYDGKKLFVPVSVLLQEALKETTILFVEEKQNLYIDEVRETELWASTLTHLSYGSTHASLYKSLHTWVTDGLDALVEIANVKGTDGILGWTSNPDVFVTGLRVLHGATVLISTHSFALPDAESLSIHNKLQALLNAGHRYGMHRRWVSALQSCLESANDC